jgi:alpha-glucosidase
VARQTEWWRHGVFYQVYLRSFADGNADGTGDIAGLRSRLGYIESLGVDGLWVNPWYVSPLHDGGYDVADYRDIDPRYGTLDQAVDLIAEAGRHGLRVLVDLVPNHTSSEHFWFIEALGSESGSEARSRYHFRAGTGEGGKEPPNDWLSVFGGPAWTRVPDGEWYLHLFDETQPDLNWENRQVRSEFEDILRFWLDRGAAGFRVDVAHGLAKDPSYRDLGSTDGILPAKILVEDHPYWDQPALHEVVRGWRKVLDEYPDTVMVAEAWVDDPKRWAAFLRSDEYHQSFDFRFTMSPWLAKDVQGEIEVSVEAAASVGSVPTWTLSNHDVVRQATRYGLPQDLDARDWLLDGDRSLLDEATGQRRARAALLLMLALPGSVYLYQGEELGLPEVHDLPLAVLDDPVWTRSAHRQKGRDGARVPIPWSSAGPSFGFGENGSWLPQPAEWGRLSVEAETGDADSMLELYRSAIAIRSDLLRFEETIDWLDLDEGVLAFRRGAALTCLVNFGPGETTIPDGEILMASSPITDRSLGVDGSVWVREPGCG